MTESDPILHPHAHAAAAPERPAIIMAESGETMSYAELEAYSNRAAQLFRARGLKRGDVVAFFLENSVAFLPLCWAAQRSGLIYVAISTRLSAAEARYIVEDSGASLIVASAGLAEIATQLPAEKGRFALGGEIAGYDDLAAALATMPPNRIEDESQGRDMLYSSGTTGQPKGVTGALPEEPFDATSPLLGLTKMLYGFAPDMIYLSPAPLYHAAPLRYCMTVHRYGGTVIIMKKFDPERYLALIEKHGVTHTQLVPTMFVRMLKLPEDVRARYDLSSLRAAIHAAAPCPVDVKRRMLDWWGEVIHEYYASTEGTGFCAVGPAEWRERPGTVGRALIGDIRILDDEGNRLPPRREGGYSSPAAASSNITTRRKRPPACVTPSMAPPSATSAMSTRTAICS